MLRSTCCALALGLCAFQSSAEVLLAHADQHWIRSDATAWDVQLGFQIRLAQPGEIATNYAPLGTSAFPFEGIPDDGSLGLFNSASEGTYTIGPADDVHFATFESLLANSSNDAIAMHLFYWNSEGSMFLSPAVGGEEWTFLGTGGMGADLQSVKLNILNIDIRRDGSAVHVDADIRWELWGEPLPTPGTGLVILAGTAIALRRRRA